MSLCEINVEEPLDLYSESKSSSPREIFSQEERYHEDDNTLDASSLSSSSQMLSRQKRQDPNYHNASSSVETDTTMMLEHLAQHFVETQSSENSGLDKRSGGDASRSFSDDVTTEEELVDHLVQKINFIESSAADLDKQKKKKEIVDHVYDQKELLEKIRLQAKELSECYLELQTKEAWIAKAQENPEKKTQGLKPSRARRRISTSKSKSQNKPPEVPPYQREQFELTLKQVQHYHAQFRNTGKSCTRVSLDEEQRQYINVLEHALEYRAMCDFSWIPSTKVAGHSKETPEFSGGQLLALLAETQFQLDDLKLKLKLELKKNQTLLEEKLEDPETNPKNQNSRNLSSIQAGMIEYVDQLKVQLDAAQFAQAKWNDEKQELEQKLEQEAHRSVQHLTDSSQQNQRWIQERDEWQIEKATLLSLQEEYLAMNESLHSDLKRVNQRSNTAHQLTQLVLDQHDLLCEMEHQWTRWFDDTTLYWNEHFAQTLPPINPTEFRFHRHAKNPFLLLLRPLT